MTSQKPDRANDSAGDQDPEFAGTQGEGGQRLQQILDNLFAFVGLLSTKGVLLEANRAPLDVAGLQREDVIGKPFAETYWWSFSPETQQQLQAAMRRAAQGECVRYDTLVRIAGGQFISIDFSLRPLFDVKGRVTQLVASGVDITERKQAEATLHDNEERFRQVVENIREVFWMSDMDTKQVLYVSPRYEQVWGRPGSEVYKTPLAWTEAIHPEDRERVLAAIDVKLANGKYNQEYRIIRPDGSVRWILDRGFPVKGENSRPRRMVGIAEDITERKQADEKLRQSEADLAEGQQVAKLGSWRLDTASNKLRWSAEVYRIFGVEPTEFHDCYDDFLNCVLPDDRPRILKIIAEAKANGNSFEMEYRIQTRIGDLKTIREIGHATKDAGGKVVNLFGTAQDITELKKAEEELRWKTAFLEAQVDCSIDGILVVDSEGKTILQNQRINDLWKIPQDIAATEDDAKMVEFVANQTKNPSQFKSRITHLYSHPDEVSRDEIELVDGTILDRYSSPVRDRGGEYYGRIWTFRDITGEKQSEAALRLSEAQLRATFENAAIGIALVNPNGRPAKCNPALVRMLGYSEAELCGMSFSEFTHPEDVEMDVRLFQSLLGGEYDHYEIEKRYLHKDGHIILGRLKVSLVKQPDSTSPPAIGMIEDITEQRKLEDQFRQSQKMEAFGQLAGGVAHDFNNILAVIQLQAGLLTSGRNLSPEELNFAEAIGKAAERGANLTRQLLLFSRKQTLQPRNLQLKELVANITRMLERTLGEHVQLQFKFSEEPLCIYADPGMIDQILLNLTVNARDAMPKGGEIVIETSAAEFDEASAKQTPQARAGRFVCLSVSDSGCGIPPEVMPRIFEPFFTTKEVGKGTGLGLATVFGIVQQHGGWINVYSEVGRGTTFRIYLPRLLAGTMDTKLLPRSRGPIRGGTETILMVEDEPALRASAVTTLFRLGYRVLEASSGNEALKVWKQHRDEIRLLLTDLVMPGGMTGRELAAQLLEQNPKLNVVYSSGYSAEIVGKDFSPKENVNFLSKPYEAERLAQTIRNSLDGLIPAT
jgi:PAS domain S-box-containing protein